MLQICLQNKVNNIHIKCKKKKSKDSLKQKIKQKVIYFLEIGRTEEEINSNNKSFKVTDLT